MEKCRLCYTNPDPEMCQHIFNTKSEPPIWKIIEQLSNLIITKKDPYTKNICGACFNNLVKYNDFRRQILDTDHRILHAKEQLSKKTNNDCDYFEVHCTPTSSDSDDFMIKKEQIEIEEDPLKIEDENNEEFDNITVIDNQNIKEATPTNSGGDDSIVKEEHIEIEEDPLKIEDEIKEELNNSSVAVMGNQDTKEFVIVDGYNNNNIPASYTSLNDNSNRTNEGQSNKCSTDGSYIISTNNNDLRLNDNDDIVAIDENKRSIAKNVCSGKNFDGNSSCIKEESDVEMSTSDRKKYNTRNSQRLNVDNSIDTKDKITIENSESTKRHRTARYGLNVNLKPHNRTTLQKHAEMQIHEIPLKSNICNKQSSDIVNLYTHKQVYTNKKSYRCNVCDKRFSRQFDLLCHSRVHTGEKPFKCDICNKRFSVKPHLGRHKRVHTGEKPFTCNVCNKHFSRKETLLGHKRVHTGEKPFKCNICKKQFSHRTNLLHHERVHTGEKPFKCNICSMQFSQRAHLWSHKRVHTDEKPFKFNV